MRNSPYLVVWSRPWAVHTIIFLDAHLPQLWQNRFNAHHLCVYISALLHIHWCLSCRPSCRLLGFAFLFCRYPSDSKRSRSMGWFGNLETGTPPKPTFANWDLLYMWTPEESIGSSGMTKHLKLSHWKEVPACKKSHLAVEHQLLETGLWAPENPQENPL